MTLTPDQIAQLAGDRRRAAALVIHYGRDSWPGVKTVMQEMADADRVAPTIYAILDLYDQLVPELRSDLGQQFMSNHLLRIAGMENSQ